MSNTRDEGSEKNLNDKGVDSAEPMCQIHETKCQIHEIAVDSAEPMCNTGISTCEEVKSGTQLVDLNSGILMKDQSSYQDVHFDSQLPINIDCEIHSLSEHQDFPPVNEVENFYSNEHEKNFEVSFGFYVYIKKKLKKLYHTLIFFMFMFFSGFK